MALKPHGQVLNIAEQIIEDPVSGMTFQFVVCQDSDAPYRLKIFGDLPFGNREILFDAKGKEAGAGVALENPGTASWIRDVSAS